MACDHRLGLLSWRTDCNRRYANTAASEPMTATEPTVTATQGATEPLELESSTSSLDLVVAVEVWVEEVVVVRVTTAEIQSVSVCGFLSVSESK